MTFFPAHSSTTFANFLSIFKKIILVKFLQVYLLISIGQKDLLVLLFLKKKIILFSFDS